MDKNERERLTKAHQCALLLLSDWRDIVAKTDNLALEELMVVRWRAKGTKPCRASRRRK